MKIDIIASTKPGYSLPKEDAIIFSGKAAGICYLPDTIETLFNEPKEKTLSRANRTIISGHHSVFCHPTYSIMLEGIPKILAMVLNNEKVYNTSEKSGRYTVMDATSEDGKLYHKWIPIFSEEIKKEYPDFDDKKIKKLALENARYLISVFTPATIMEYTTNICQLNYIINWAKDYINNENTDDFSLKLKKVFKEFVDAMPDIEIEGMDTKLKNREFSLFAKRDRKEEFGENYSTNYLASFTELGQSQRHRTLSLEMQLLETPQFYIPPIIKGKDLEKEWIKDISSIADLYPQGMLVKVNERGTIENFVLKCTERICGAAQLEIMDQTIITMKKYMDSVKETDPTLYNYLLPYSKGARCTFPGYKCNSPCIFGPKDALTRKI